MTLKETRYARWTVIVLFTLALFFSYHTASADGPVNEIVNAELRMNRARLKNAMGYQVLILAGYATPSAYTYTAGWISMENGQRNANGQCSDTYACRFSQVGYFNDQYGIRWFVYAEQGVICYAGTSAWGNRGCIGEIGDIITFNRWHKFRLAKNADDPYWLAYVYDHYGEASHVALIQEGSSKAYRVNISAEEHWNSDFFHEDPFVYLNYEFYRPQRQTSTPGVYRDWHRSTSTSRNRVFLWSSKANHIICPPFGVEVFSTAPPQWFSGTGGRSCNVPILF